MLKNLIALLLTTAFTYSAHADAIQAYFGFNRTNVNFGAGYEHELDRGLGIGGFFHFASDDDTNGVPEVITVAANAKVHFRGVSDKVDLYAAPGFGMHMYERGTTDETILGPSLQLGVLFQVSDRVGVGVEQLNIYNWLNDDAGVSGLEYLNATLVYEI